MHALGFLASIMMGISLGLIGGGGSILTVPILYYLFQQDSLLATRNSLFIVGATALAGAILNARQRNIDLKVAAFFAAPSFAGVFVTRHFLLPRIPESVFTVAGFTLTKPLLVMMVFAVLMVVASRAMIRSGGVAKEVSTPAKSSTSSLLATIAKGFFVGTITGFVGAGGGFLMIPVLVIQLRLPMRIAIGTSLAIISANSLFGFLISESSHGPTDWKLLLSIAGLGILGLVAGHSISSRVPEAHLKRGFGFFVFFVGSAILVDQLMRL